MRRLLALILVGTLAGCSLSAADREAYRESAVDAASLAIDVLQSIGVAPDGVSPKVIQYANAVCVLLDVGSPVIVQVINNRVDKHNADAAEAGDALTDTVTVEEFTAGLNGICDLVRSLAKEIPDEPAAST